ncbi:MAG: amino acid adenylation domain-containing protein [Candidatus Aminicenantes bacterium]|jgi:amino acid adenylation domain-containing protein
MRNFKKSEEIAVAASQSLKEREYWLEQLSGELIVTRFPYDFNKGVLDKPIVHDLDFEFPAELCCQLLKLSNGSDSRLHMVLVAGIVLLLYKYTGNTDIILGIPIDKQDIEGEFTNTVLALKNHLEKQVTYRELLLEVRNTIIDAAENQNYPIEALLDDLKMNFSGYQFPLFDVAVILENIQDKNYMSRASTSINFIFARKDERIKVVIGYDSLLYERMTVERIANHLNKILHEAISNVNLAVDQIDILSGEERTQLLYDFNSSAADYPQNQTIHGLFAMQVEKKPANPALVYDGKDLTYKKLDEKANQLARTLKEKGVCPDTIVGIAVQRSLEMVVGMLGILKAGGAYLPIDPLYPQERIEYMIRDSAAAVVLTTGTWEENLPFAGEIIRMDQDNSYHANGSNPVAENISNHSAYVIYTSGSTGNPKGVIIHHRAIVNTLFWRKNYYNFGQEQVVLQLPSFSFDSSVEDIFTPLISSAALVLINYENQFDLDYLQSVIQQNQVTHFLIVPNLYKSFLEQMPGCLKNLKSVTVAGDNFTEELVREHREKLPKVKLYNEYGPTENSVCSTVYEFNRKNTNVLIGKPINNVKCYIQDENRKIDPVGVPGELWVSGAGLARGYLNRVELTGDKFIRNPFIPGEMIYKTGDCARWRGDGNLEFLGRKDHQVKIRGFRIELGEIENQLLQHPEIKEAIVMAKEDKRGDKYLCAYLVARVELNVTELREHLLKYLPEYMVPAQFVELKQMPLTPNGKIDRKKLPEPDQNINSGVRYVAPQTQMEKKLEEIWKDELELEKVGIHDNYFNIGGDSIKSIRLINLVNQKLNTNLKIVDLYINNTIEKLANKLENLTPTPCDVDYNEALIEMAEWKNRIIQRG